MLGVAHRDADLPDAGEPFLDQALMAGVEWLEAADEQRGRLLRIEGRAQLLEDPLRPRLRRSIRLDPDVETLWPHEHPVGVVEPAGVDAIDKDGESVAERRARGRGRADEVGDRGAAALDHAVAQPAHAAGLLDAILDREIEIAIDVGAHFVVVEHHGVEHRRKRLRERGLAGAGQAHHENAGLHHEPHVA